MSIMFLFKNIMFNINIPMGKSKKSSVHDFNLARCLSEAESVGCKWKKEVQKYNSIKSKIVAAEVRLPAREEPTWNDADPPSNPCPERVELEKVKKLLRKAEEAIKAKWEKFCDV